MVRDRIHASLCEQVQRVLEVGGRMAVIGWMEKNHSDFTRGIPADIVSFHEADPRTLPEKLDLVIFTRFGSHGFGGSIRGRYRCVPGVRGPGVVKTILESCADVIARRTGRTVRKTVSPEKNSETAEEEPSTVPRSTLLEDEDLLDFITTPTTRRREMTGIEGFARAFSAEAGKDKDGRVSSFILAKLMKEHGLGKEARKLSRQGILNPVIMDGKSKVSWYTAGPKLREALAGSNPEPENPLERAKYIIAQEPAVLAEKTELEAKLEAVNQKLGRIKQAKELIGKLEELMKQ